MISAITGQVRQVDEARVQLQVGPMLYELLIPAADVSEVQGMIEQETTFHTIMYLEGDATRGNLEPRLLGFLRTEDREFFELFITVKGIGPRRAMRALSVPVAEIAHAIEAKDTRFLVTLPEIGKRTAEQIIAELAGRLKDFAVGLPARPGAAAAGRRPDQEEDAIAGMMALDERLRRPDAEHLLDRAKQSSPALKTADALLREMLRQRSLRG